MCEKPRLPEHSHVRWDTTNTNRSETYMILGCDEGYQHDKPNVGIIYCNTTMRAWDMELAGFCAEIPTAVPPTTDILLTTPLTPTTYPETPTTSSPSPRSTSHKTSSTAHLTTTEPGPTTFSTSQQYHTSTFYSSTTTPPPLRGETPRETPGSSSPHADDTTSIHSLTTTSREAPSPSSPHADDMTTTRSAQTLTAEISPASPSSHWITTTSGQMSTVFKKNLQQGGLGTPAVVSISLAALTLIVLVSVIAIFIRRRKRDILPRYIPSRTASSYTEEYDPSRYDDLSFLSAPSQGGQTNTYFSSIHGYVPKILSGRDKKVAKDNNVRITNMTVGEKLRDSGEGTHKVIVSISQEEPKPPPPDQLGLDSSPEEPRRPRLDNVFNTSGVYSTPKPPSPPMTSVTSGSSYQHLINPNVPSVERRHYVQHGNLAVLSTDRSRLMPRSYGNPGSTGNELTFM